jgi:hypothetical protein
MGRRSSSAQSAKFAGRYAGYGAQSSRVHSAELQDRAAVPPVLEGTAEEFPRLEHLWVDQGYTGTGKAWGSKNVLDGVLR